MKTTVLMVSVICAGLVLTGFPASLMAGCPTYGYSYASYAPYVVKQAVVVKEVPVYVAAFTPVVAVGYSAAVGYVAPPAMPSAAMPAAMPAAAPSACDELKTRVQNLERLLQQAANAGAIPPGAQANTGPTQQPNAPGTPGVAEKVPPPQPQAPPAQPQQLPKGENLPGVTPPANPPTGAQTVNAVIAQRCAECHTAGRLKGGFALVGEDQRLLLLTPEQIRKVIASVKGKPGKPPTMPKGKAPLDDAEFGAILELVDQP